MSTTISVVCYKSKVLKNNESPLMLRVCKDGKRKYESLGISLNPKYWDFKANKPTAKCPNREYIEKLIAEKKRAYADKVIELKAMANEFTATTLMEKVNKPIRRKTVKDMFDLYIQQLVSANRLRYADMYKLTMNSLLKFNKHLNIPFSDVDVTWLKKYELWLQAQGLAINTIGTRFRHLRVIYNLAIDEKVVKREYYPFNTFKVSKLNQIPAKRSISKDAILKVLNYEGKTGLECFSIDLFTFSYLTAGINFVDIARLTDDNIMENRLVYIRKKTKKQIKVPLQSQAVELIEKYKQQDNPYLFPILSPVHKTEQQKVNRVHKVIAKVNKTLKRIGEQLDVSIDLTTYVARHSFATVLKRSGVNTSLISEALGHSSEKVTQIYLDSFGNDQMDDAMKNLL
ncbi:site-specific integrase [Parabacteroides acidifaciens]|uniref:Site-specific integrase n=1 Tax=Parabacteroides acidifaciens TaxID=2290935 RepID=A0A3D8HB33_9BACT|nr:site-specific integrase [Parabacteroides acidifaciens]MBC8603145.1 site-specific integrase [Parabacteroides acidifaciens]RDU48148.1 site-specific integrase [Parabacteroides acidifaciens]